MAPGENQGYHKIATGAAYETVQERAAEQHLKLFGSCFCPFVQRVWIALEYKKLPYQYIEVDPYAKPKSLVEVNPRGLVPALRHGDWATYESTVLMEYIDELQPEPGLLGTYGQDPRGRAHQKVWADHVNRHLTPLFYQLLQAQEEQKQVKYGSELKEQLQKLIDAADPVGPFFSGDKLGWVDVTFAPWMLRFRRVLGPYRGWPDAEPGSRWARWLDALEKDESVKATTSDDKLYIDSYARYAENRPNTSQLANAINDGRGLP